MKIIAHKNNTSIIEDGVMSECQLKIFHELETLDKPVRNDHQRMVGTTTLICYYADLTVKTRNRNVIIVCHDPTSIYKIFINLYQSYVRNVKNKLTYPNGCTIQFIKTNANLTSKRFDNTDVFFDNSNMIFDTLTLTKDSRIKLI